MTNRYREYDNKSLVGVYIFNYPAENSEDREALRKELERRGLIDWADHTFRELYDIFTEKWVEKEKEIESD
ncbi:MAG: hypothetical protein N2V75_00495 [Methanophagales archaeon]|nr:hypothetical protein [Methanophagales archaeon]